MIQKNNKGFTLVEVLIAITILGIVVTPLLHTFVSSARTNAKARNLLNATMVAENIMEELKVSNFASLSEKYKDTMESDGSSHHFSVNQTVDNKAYKAVVKLIPQTSSMVNIHSMNEDTCGYYAQSQEMDATAAEEFYRRHLGYANNAVAQKDSAALEAMMSRTIKIVIDKDANDYTYATLIYEYELPRGYTADDDRVYTFTTSLFHQEAAGSSVQLEALYVYFYPFKTTGTDNIVIENKQDIETDLYLVQMQGEGNIKNIHLTEGGSQNTSFTRICTNMVSGTDYMVGQGYHIASFTSLGSEKDVVNLYEVEILVYRDSELIHTYSGSFMEQNK